MIEAYFALAEYSLRKLYTKRQIFVKIEGLIAELQVTNGNVPSSTNGEMVVSLHTLKIRILNTHKKAKAIWRHDGGLEAHRVHGARTYRRDREHGRCGGFDRGERLQGH